MENLHSSPDLAEGEHAVGTLLVLLRPSLVKLLEEGRGQHPLTKPFQRSDQRRS